MRRALIVPLAFLPLALLSFGALGADALALRPQSPAPAAPAKPAAPAAQTPAAAQAPAAKPSCANARADVQVELVKVVDGDTFHVKLDGKVEKLRLLCVDTEEKLSVSGTSATKPGTVFGEETSHMAHELFDKLGTKEKPATVGLRFPNGERRRDMFGRMLCHLVLPDGRDYDLMLVRDGWSPYFTKYGQSELCHGDFVEAQRLAREEKRGIWNPKTNEPATPGAPAAKRPYDQLLPWWDARGEAVAAFHERRAQPGAVVFECELAASLEKATESKDAVLVFGEVGEVYTEDDGSRTVLLRSTEKDRALRVRISKEKAAAFTAIALDELAQEFKQNYVFYRGKIERATSRAGFHSRCEDPAAFELAGPQVVLPDAKAGTPVEGGAGKSGAPGKSGG